MNIIDHIETITYQQGDIIKYSFPLFYECAGNKCTINNIDGAAGATLNDNNCYYKIIVTYKNGLCHSINGQPAVTIYDSEHHADSFIWCDEGVIHRESLPAIVTTFYKYHFINNYQINDME